MKNAAAFVFIFENEKIRLLSNRIYHTPKIKGESLNKGKIYSDAAVRLFEYRYIIILCSDKIVKYI